MSKLQLDGSTIYRFPDSLTDVKLHGTSVIDLGVEEVRVWPDGWGYVLVSKRFGEAAMPAKKWLDGSTRNYTYYGQIEITL